MSIEKNKQKTSPKKAASPSKPRPVQRVSFPLSRVKTIMKSSPDANTLGLDAVALTARAAELFVIYLVKESIKSGKSEKVEYSDIYKIIHGNPVFDFLYDIIPQKVSYKECRQRIEESERKEKAALSQIEI